MDDISIPESLDINMDSLLNSWHLQYFSKVDEFCHDDSENVPYPDSIYRRRLERLYHLIPMTYNKEVRKCIDFYAGKRRDLVRYVLGMADYYFPVIEQVLEEEDLPLELKYLPIVESALNATALSRVGAGGLWQFMLPTGKIYGLEINSLVDERRDAIKSTRAACRYFKDMYNMFGDWHLALASFNCGPGGVKKAIRRANGKTDFWSIYPYLPRETRSYVPLFIAAAYITNYYCEHNICPVQTSLPLATDTVVVNNMLHFEQVTELLDIDIELLRLLNPQYRRDIIPGHIEPSVLKLPAAGAYSFIDIEDTVYAHRVEELLGNRLPLDVILSDKSATREKITYTAAARESLYAIADRYGVTAKDIRRWNQLGSNYVPKGKRLTLYVNNGGARFASAVQSTEAPAAAPKAVASKAAVPVQTTEQAREGYITYTVQSGDSLYTISRKYPGVSAGVLQKANNLSGTTIRPGQKLKIPVG
jgi:membrane-bound lytic murein transglycosylase D